MKNVMLAVSLGLFVAASSAFAQDDDGEWLADAKTGCKVWVPDYSRSYAVEFTTR
jgi:hypothetical protein